MKRSNIGYGAQLVGKGRVNHTRAIFVDRDGTLNLERRDYVKSPNEMEIIPGACEQIARIAEGYPYIIVITNQSVVGRGIITKEMLGQIDAKLEREFYDRTGRRINHVFFCPHRPEDNCNCRKPKTELFVEASRKYDLALQQCVFVGDKDSDEEAARRIGCQFIRVKTNSAEVLGKMSV